MHSINLRVGLTPAAPFLATIRTALYAAGRRIALWHRILSTRGDLAEMDPRMLSDLGISRAQAEFQLRAAPWALAAWRRH